ncbi:type III pantothenate kinase [Ochrovirga pacifica]|uniref:type III pantothenate kinase n=1 Tax=Ochrovirga pacifica TaxID=1042376 RepID=UPI0002557FB1|nr:type III pantothenate kinase [Ochrovirga pacifica]
MHLIIDEGNTRIKLAIFYKKKLQEIVQTTSELCEIRLNELLERYTINGAILSSVTDQTLTVFNKLPIAQKVILTSETPVPFTNAYKTPKTLGVDRIALVMAACQQYSQNNTLVIDAGTCVTYDFIDKDAIYMGGAIAPGLQMRFSAMHQYTQKLPALDVPKEKVSFIGQSTKECLESGVVNGMVFEMEGAIQQYQQQFGKVNVILTGGDANFLCKQLKNSIFVNQNFLLEGLNEVLTYQNKDEAKFK